MENDLKEVKQPTLEERVNGLAYHDFIWLRREFMKRFSLKRTEQFKRRISGEYKMSSQELEYLENALNVRRHDN